MPNITHAQAQQLIALREVPDEKTRLRRKAALMSEIKSILGIPQSVKVKVEIDNPNAPHYLALKSSITGELLRPLAGSESQQLKPEPAWPFDKPKQPAPAPEAAWPYPPPPPVQRPGHAPLAGMDAGDIISGTGRIDRPRPNTPILRLGSLALEDVAALLRADADTRETFAKSEGEMSDHVKIENGRLYFVL